MFQEVVGDDKIDTVVGERGQGLAIINDRHRYKFGCIKLREICSQFRIGEAIHVSHPGLVRYSLGLVQGADLNTVTSQEACGDEVAQRVAGHHVQSINGHQCRTVLQVDASMGDSHTVAAISR